MLPESDHEIPLLTQNQPLSGPRLFSIKRVRFVNSSTDNCSARLSSRGSAEISAAKFKFFRALRKVFLLVLKACFTTCTKSVSSQGKSTTLLRSSWITADITFGGGVNTPGAT